MSQREESASSVRRRVGLTACDKAKLAGMIRLMQAASSRFYSSAVHTGNHAFIEFTGLMNEYIKLCQDALAAGEDFTTTSVHTGKALPMAAYHAAYLGEKIGCIYGTALAAPKLRAAFEEKLYGGET